jgi:hypothetical protein
VTTVDVASVRFAGAPVRTKPNGTLHFSYEDVNKDGFLDLMMHFSTQALMLDADSTEATLTASAAWTDAFQALTRLSSFRDLR